MGLCRIDILSARFTHLYIASLLYSRGYMYGGVM